MRTDIAYPSQRAQLATLKSDNPGCLVVYGGSTVTVLTGAELAAHNADRANVTLILTPPSP